MAVGIYERSVFIAGPEDVYSFLVRKEGCTYHYLGEGPITYMGGSRVAAIGPSIVSAPKHTYFLHGTHLELSRRQYWEGLVETGKLVDRAYPSWPDFELPEAEESSIKTLERKLSDKVETDKIMLRLFDYPPTINPYIKNKPNHEKSRIIRGAFLYLCADRYHASDFVVLEILFRCLIDSPFFEKMGDPLSKQRVMKKLKGRSISLKGRELESLLLNEFPSYPEHYFAMEMPVDFPVSDKQLIHMGFKELKIEPND